jgi:predicted Fe-Mo cluster-binding NifX family protein
MAAAGGAGAVAAAGKVNKRGQWPLGAVEERKEEAVVMKIAVPIVEGRFSDHFGGAESFALYTIDESRKTVDERVMVAPPQHGHGVFPMWLRQLGTSVVIAGGMGPRATGMFADHGIQVVLGAQGEDPDVLVRSFLDGTLEATGEPCHEQSFHDCGHHSPRTGGCGGHDHDN